MQIKYLEPGKRGASWYIRGRDRTGRFECSTGARSRRGAETFAERFLAERSRRRVPGAGETVGFATAAQHYRAFKKLSRHDAKLVDALARHFGETDCRTITHAMLVDAAHALRPRGADTTKNRKVVSPAAAVLHYASRQKWCEYQRIEKFQESRKSTREAATDGTMRLLVANVEAPPRKSKFGRKKDYTAAHKRVLLAMLYELGLRIMDTLRIEWANVDLETARVRVRISKTDDWASLTLSGPLVAVLASLPDKRGRLFPWSSTRGVYAWLKPLRERLGVTYTPHMSRHALATAASDAGIPDKKAAELGVWRDARSLHRYQHVKPDAIPGRSAAVLLAGFGRERKGK
jgi:integrase